MTMDKHPQTNPRLDVVTHLVMTIILASAALWLSFAFRFPIALIIVLIIAVIALSFIIGTPQTTVKLKLIHPNRPLSFIQQLFSDGGVGKKHPQQLNKPSFRLQTRTGKKIIVCGPSVVGRAPSRSDNRGKPLVLSGNPSTVSRTHALVVPQQDGLLVTDLNSSNGTKIRRPNGQIIELISGNSEIMLVGDCLQLGEEELILTQL